MSEVGVFIPVSEVFPDVSNDFETFKRLVGSLSRTDALFWSARLNLMLSNPWNTNDIGKQEYAMRLFFTDDEVERINRFAAKHGGAEHVRVFMRAQLLEMIRWTSLFAHDHHNDGTAFEDPDMRRRYVQAALIASDIWGRRTLDGRLKTTGNKLMDRRRTMHAIRSGIAPNSIGVDLVNALCRGITIYGEMFRRSYKTAEQDFATATGISLDQYLACTCAFTGIYANVTPEGAARNPGGFNVNALGAHVQPDVAEVLRKYVTFDSQTADELREALWGNRRASDVTEDEPFDVKSLRERPILRAVDGRAIIMDSAFYRDKFSVGPLFAIAKEIGSDGRTNTLFGAFGYAFESYVESLLKTMYPSSASHLSNRVLYKPKFKTSKGEIEFADACLDDGPNIVLFEIKGAFIKEETLHDEDVNAYLSELLKKYGVTQGSRKDRKIKGIGQLARTVQQIVANEEIDVDQCFKHASCIYPVLLVYDTLMSTPGHAEFFACEFAKLVHPEHEFATGYMRKGRFTIAPLTIMTIEDLELLQSSVEQFRLVDLLREYCNATKGGLRLSLFEFMRLSRDRFKVVHSKVLLEQSLNMLEKTQNLLFPDAPIT